MTVVVHCEVCPVRTDVGLHVTETDLMVDAGFTVKFIEFEAPPPGDGFVTTTAYDPAVAWSLVLSEIASFAGLTKVAACGLPL